MRDNVLVLASVASMIDQFNIPNIKLLIEMGFHVDVACNFLNGSTCSDEKISQLKTKLNDMGVGIYQIDFARNAFNVKRNFKAFHQVMDLMKTNRYKFIHCHSPIGGLCGRITGHMTHTKVIYTAHGFHFYKGAPWLNWLIYYPTERFLSRYTDVLITINKEDFIRAKTFHAKKVEYIPGVGIDIDKVQAVIVDRTEKRKKLGIPKNAFLLISVGELNKNKNHELAIKALSQMKCDKNVFYIIVGEGPLKEHLTGLIASLGMETKVRFLGFRTDVIELLKASDCFVFPSLREGLPVSLMEAMASSLPVVCSNIRGNTDLVDDEVNGYLFKKFDTSSLTKCLCKVITTESKLMENFLTQAEPFSQSTILAQIKEIYLTVLIGKDGESSL